MFGSDQADSFLFTGLPTLHGHQNCFECTHWIHSLEECEENVAEFNEKRDGLRSTTAPLTPDYHDYVNNYLRVTAMGDGDWYVPITW